MHEMSLVASLHDIIENAHNESPFERVQKVFITLGTLSCVDAETLRWCIGSTASGTRIENAEIVISHEPAVAECTQCQCHYEPDSLMSPCPQCGAQAQRLVSGRDMRVTALDVVPLQDDIPETSNHKTSIPETSNSTYPIDPLPR